MTSSHDLHSARFRTILRFGSAASLGALFTTLLSGCCTSSTCGCEGDTFTNVEAVDVPEQEVIDAGRQGAGPIDPEFCPELCAELYGRAVSCEDVGPASPSMSSTGGGGAEEVGMRTVECVVESSTVCEGRRHVSVQGDHSGRGPTEVAAWLARAAAAEAASVPAFLALRDELGRLGAPAGLIEATERAAADEVRHAKTMRVLAHRAGAERQRGYPKAIAPERSLFDLALENAVEGCVYETFSGLTAMHQAKHARDGALRNAMRAIAGDEVRHGALAWQIHGWACGQLSAEEIAAIEEAMRAAAARMVDRLGDESLSASTRAELGLPDGEVAAQLARGAQRVLWG